MITFPGVPCIKTIYGESIPFSKQIELQASVLVQRSLLTIVNRQVQSYFAAAISADRIIPIYRWLIGGLRIFLPPQIDKHSFAVFLKLHGEEAHCLHSQFLVDKEFLPNIALDVDTAHGIGIETDTQTPFHLIMRGTLIVPPTSATERP